LTVNENRHFAEKASVATEKNRHNGARLPTSRALVGLLGKRDIAIETASLDNAIDQ
jgi:hypothetical protein